MAGDWRTVRLGDLIGVKHGWPFKSKLFSEQLTGRPIVVNIGNFRYSGGFRFESTTVKEYLGEYPTEYELMPGDVLMVMTCQTPGGEILGIPGRIPSDGKTYLHNQRLGKVDVRHPEKIDIDFLYWLFHWSEFNRHLFVTASGSKILHTAPTRIESFAFALPSLDEQRAIAHILGTLDDKIELNRRMNETLEEMARAIFKSWFVDFDPVRAKAEGRDPGLPKHIADLFPNSFEGSELGEIPAGWEKGDLGDVAIILDSKRVPLSGRERSQRRGPYPYYGATSVMDYVDDYLFDGIYVLVGEDGSVVTADGYPFTQYVWGKLWVNNHAHVLQGKGSISTEHILLSLNHTNIGAYVTGAVQLKLNQRNMKAIPFTLASPAVHKAFEERIAPLFERLRAIHEESQTLVSIRDALLPRLISGELRVGEAARMVEKAVPDQATH